MLNHYSLYKGKILCQLLLVLFLLSGKVWSQYPVQTPITSNVDQWIHGYYEWLPSDYNTQPTKKNNPPIGVIGPRIPVMLSIPNSWRVDNKYMEPLISNVDTGAVIIEQLNKLVEKIRSDCE